MYCQLIRFRQDYLNVFKGYLNSSSHYLTKYFEKTHLITLSSLFVINCIILIDNKTILQISNPNTLKSISKHDYKNILLILRGNMFHSCAYVHTSMWSR